jgi:hypothetical protein
LQENQMIERLINSFDDFKERLIRIEENVKNFNSVIVEVDLLKIKVAQVEESAKSAHKRADTAEKAADQKDNDIKWLKRQVMTGAIGLVFTVLAAIIVANVKGWI